MHHHKHAREHWPLITCLMSAGSGGEAMERLGLADPLVHVAHREYVINSNWKVFCDNYLVCSDGGCAIVAC